MVYHQKIRYSSGSPNKHRTFWRDKRASERQFGEFTKAPVEQRTQDAYYTSRIHWMLPIESSAIHWNSVKPMSADEPESSMTANLPTDSERLSCFEPESEPRERHWQECPDGEQWPMCSSRAHTLYDRENTPLMERAEKKNKNIIVAFVTCFPSDELKGNTSF